MRKHVDKTWGHFDVEEVQYLKDRKRVAVQPGKYTEFKSHPNAQIIILPRTIARIAVGKKCDLPPARRYTRRKEQLMGLGESPAESEHRVVVVHDYGPDNKAVLEPGTPFAIVNPYEFEVVVDEVRLSQTKNPSETYLDREFQIVTVWDPNGTRAPKYPDSMIATMMKAPEYLDPVMTRVDVGQSLRYQLKNTTKLIESEWKESFSYLSQAGILYVTLYVLQRYSEPNLTVLFLHPCPIYQEDTKATMYMKIFLHKIGKDSVKPIYQDVNFGKFLQAAPELSKPLDLSLSLYWGTVRDCELLLKALR